MKKLLSLLLALLMLLCSVSAVAETEETATFTADLKTITSYIDFMYSAVYPDGEMTSSADGMYVVLSGDGMLPLSIVTDSDLNVTALFCTLQGTMDEISAASEQLGVSASLAAMGVFMAENPDADAFQAASSTFQEDFTGVLDCMINATQYTDAELAEGVSSMGTIMTYPAGCYCQVAESDGVLSGNVIIVLFPKD